MNQVFKINFSDNNDMAILTSVNDNKISYNTKESIVEEITKHFDKNNIKYIKRHIDNDSTLFNIKTKHSNDNYYDMYINIPQKDEFYIQLLNILYLKLEFKNRKINQFKKTFKTIISYTLVSKSLGNVANLKHKQIECFNKNDNEIEDQSTKTK